MGSLMITFSGAVLAQKFWGHCPISRHHRVHFLRSPKPKKYELHIGLLKSVISRVVNSVVG